MAPTPNYFNLIHILTPDISQTWWWNAVFLGFPKFFAYIFLKTFSSSYSDFPLFCHSHNVLFDFKNRLQLWQFSLKMKRRIYCFLSSISSLLFVIYLTRLSVSRIILYLLHNLTFIFSFSDYFYTFIYDQRK
jgi:hypothetical protein